MNLIELSIVIPVYNTIKYIANCIESCLDQNIHLSNYEIIVIDDGSTDGSLDIIKKYTIKYSNIILLSKKNEGVSIARNIGLSLAKGQFILFVDSDDAIKANSLNQLINEAKKNSLDCLFTNSINIENKYNSQLNNFSKIKWLNPISGIELYKEGYTRGSACGVIFNKDFLLKNNIKFPEQLNNGEDAFFMSLVSVYGVRIFYSDINFYFITERNESASRAWSYEKVINILDRLEVIESYILNHNLSAEQRKILVTQSYSVISYSTYYFLINKYYSNYFDFRKKVISSSSYPIQTYKLNRYGFKVKLLNYSFDLYVFLVFIKIFTNGIRC